MYVRFHFIHMWDYFILFYWNFFEISQSFRAYWKYTKWKIRHTSIHKCIHVDFQFYPCMCRLFISIKYACMLNLKKLAIHIIENLKLNVRSNNSMEFVIHSFMYICKQYNTDVTLVTFGWFDSADVHQLWQLSHIGLFLLLLLFISRNGDTGSNRPILSS